LEPNDIGRDTFRRSGTLDDDEEAEEDEADDDDDDGSSWEAAPGCASVAQRPSFMSSSGSTRMPSMSALRTLSSARPPFDNAATSTVGTVTARSMGTGTAFFPTVYCFVWNHWCLDSHPGSLVSNVLTMSPTKGSASDVVSLSNDW
jgi:hypothetical protein